VDPLPEAVSPLGQGDALMGRYTLAKELTSTHPWAFRWLATDRILRRTVEVHLLIGPHVADAIDVARRAALVRDARLSHIIDAGRYGEVAFVLTEEQEGTPLPEFGALEPEQARTLAGEVATVLDIAHEIGVYHLTLRPELVHLGAEPHIIVGGLGWDGALWGVTVDDPAAALRREARDAVAVLYTALTGQWPGPTPSFVPPPPQVDGSPLPPSSLAGWVPDDLDTLCRIALSPEAAGPANLAEVIDDLGSWHGRQSGARLRLDPRTSTTANLSPIRAPLASDLQPLATAAPQPDQTAPVAPVAPAAPGGQPPAAAPGAGSYTPVTPARQDPYAQPTPIAPVEASATPPAATPAPLAPSVSTPAAQAQPAQGAPDIAAPSALPEGLPAPAAPNAAMPVASAEWDGPAPFPKAPAATSNQPVPPAQGVAPASAQPIAMPLATAPAQQSQLSPDPQPGAPAAEGEEADLTFSLPPFEPPPPIDFDLPPLPTLDELLARATNTGGAPAAPPPAATEAPPALASPQAPAAQTHSDPADDVPSWLRPYLDSETPDAN
jgi:hypothetical protein